ncbi:hypothetical protein D3C77_210650 [compost metagenome]
MGLGRARSKERELRVSPLDGHRLAPTAIAATATGFTDCANPWSPRPHWDTGLGLPKICRFVCAFPRYRAKQARLLRQSNHLPSIKHAHSGLYPIEQSQTWTVFPGDGGTLKITGNYGWLIIGRFLCSPCHHAHGFERLMPETSNDAWRRLTTVPNRGDHQDRKNCLKLTGSIQGNTSLPSSAHRCHQILLPQGSPITLNVNSLLA